jgi:pimeloyl-ACP methyl ester carboxylesterase
MSPHPTPGSAPPAAGTLVFSHANGFPAGLYEPLFDAWRAAGWRVEALPKFAHDPRFPVESGWRRLRDQLLHFVEGLHAGPVVFIGHSLGGVLSLLAAVKRPDLARAVVMLDSPVVSGWRAHSVHMAKRLRLINRVGPGGVSKTRRHEWPSREAVHAHFVAKHVFARWDPRMLAGYVAHGFEEHEGRTVLAFRRDVETRIYDTLPHDVDTLLQRHPPRCPVFFLAGTQSAEMRQAGAAASRALAGPRFRWIEGTHLYPMERPDDTAAVVTAWLDELRPLA